MITKDITKGVRFNQAELNLINEYTTFTGESFSSVVRKATLDAIEDFYDSISLKEAIAQDSGEYLTASGMRELLANGE